MLFDGEDIWKDKQFTRQVRFQVGLVFQYPEYQLFEETVYKDIAFGPKNMKLSEEEIDRRVREAAAFVELPEEVMELSPFELSGGQKRRVAIAGVIAMEPKVLILDDSTSAVDTKTDALIRKAMREFIPETTKIIIAQRTASVEDADRIIVMEGGRISDIGTRRPNS